ncbi:unnamed protein product [Gongylonema pulchrum]|uniref:DUF3074 domain-containing protein n=1 Tax=Gongylonema pulchrum TaxID=637853 RepID=A0A183E7E8_9BILA|nr:unnamed protein product [Gongylonema pulchrum]
MVVILPRWALRTALRELYGAGNRERVALIYTVWDQTANSNYTIKQVCAQQTPGGPWYTGFRNLRSPSPVWEFIYEKPFRLTQPKTWLRSRSMPRVPRRMHGRTIPTPMSPTHWRNPIAKPAPPGISVVEAPYEGWRPTTRRSQLAERRGVQINPETGVFERIRPPSRSNQFH